MTNEQEKEINKLANDHAFQVPFNGTNDFYDKEKFKSFIAGAKEVIDNPEKYGLKPIIAPLNNDNILTCEKCSYPMFFQNWSKMYICNGCDNKISAKNI